MLRAKDGRVGLPGARGQGQRPGHLAAGEQRRGQTGGIAGRGGMARAAMGFVQASGTPVAIYGFIQTAQVAQHRAQAVERGRAQRVARRESFTDRRRLFHRGKRFLCRPFPGAAVPHVQVAGKVPYRCTVFRVGMQAASLSPGRLHQRRSSLQLAQFFALHAQVIPRRRAAGQDHGPFEGSPSGS